MNTSNLFGAVGAGLGFLVGGPLGAIVGGKLGYTLGNSVENPTEFASGDDPDMSLEYTDIEVTQTERFDITDFFS